MRYIRGFVLFVLVAMIAFYMFTKLEIESAEITEEKYHVVSQKILQAQEKTVPEHILIKEKYQGTLYYWIGKNTNELIAEMGEPVRKDLSSYGYTWWVYTDGHSTYMQFGITDETIKTVFATGNNLSLEPIQIGEKYQQINEKLQFKEDITLKDGISTFTFVLDGEDLAMRPLVKLSDNLFLQLYFDTFTEELSSIRLVTGDLLLIQRPYGLKYRGKLPEVPRLTDEEWVQVESGMEQQIFEITNVIRNRFQVDTLKWEDKVSEVAFLHSKDMATNNYFSHYSQNGEGLKERLEANDVYYFAAGENIAAQYIDAPAAVEGWLNSKGHREALLHEDYTHLGVGVYRLYYTQNFLTKPF